MKKQRAPRSRSYNISHFKKGDIITRLEVSTRGDGSYRGDKLLYHGLANNCIVYSHLNNNIFKENELHTLELESWENGWGLYKELKPVK